MIKHYVEIIDGSNSVYEPQQILRMYVLDESEAEKIYNTNKDKFNATHIAKFVETDHKEDAALNAPCKVKKLIDGKVEQNWSE